jgi:hypothetical protein
MLNHKLREHKQEKLMSKFKMVCILVFIAFAIMGCANKAANLQRESARNIGGNISANQVVISDVDRSITDVKWKASAPSGNYDCKADDMLRSVYCTKQ